MIRVATHEDLTEIMDIVEIAKTLMAKDNNPQWDDAYPKSTDFTSDIENKNLFLLESEGIIQGFVTIDQQQSNWYDKIDWPIDKKDAYVIHRLAVKPDYPGASKQLFDFAINIARTHHVNTVLTDTFSQNKRAQKLFEQYGFVKAGEAEMTTPPFDKGAPFYAYYKLLEE